MDIRQNNKDMKCKPYTNLPSPLRTHTPTAFYEHLTTAHRLARATFKGLTHFVSSNSNAYLRHSLALCLL